MNAIFTGIFLLSAAILCFIAPDAFLTSLLDGAQNAAKTAFMLFGVYAVWMGLSAVAEKSGLSRGAAKLLAPLTKKCFKSDDEEANGYVAMNLACNLLGLGGAATPYAVKAVKLFDRDKNSFAQKLLFVINATSVQILPATVIALRAGYHSANPADIFLPSLICTAVSTAAGILLFLAGRPWRE